jgi:Bacterial Ig domain
MTRRSFRPLFFWILFAMLGLLACDVSSLSSLGLGPASKPQVTIQSPVAGSQFKEGDDVPVQSTSADKTGIVRVELSVDGTVVRTDAPPIAQGQTSFSIIQRWKATAGNHTLSVRAYNASGAASDPAIVAITVTSSTAQATTSPVQTVLPPLGSTPVNPLLALTPTLSPTGTVATPTKRPPTKVPPLPTISAPPGVWATSIRLDPKEPKRGQFVTFYVTFLNTTGGSHDYKWRIRLFYADNPNRGFGDTTPLPMTIPAGTSEQASANNWRVTGPGGCLGLIARVFWLDASNNETEFIKPDQSGGPAAGFQVCP